MKLDDCFQLGYVVKAHGLNGEVQIFLDVTHPDNYKTLESVWIREQSGLVPFFMESYRPNGNKAIVKFEEVEGIEEAQMLKGKELFLPLSILPPKTGTEFYFHEITGFTVVDQKDGEIGTVLRVVEIGRQPLIEVEYEEKEILIPKSDHIIQRVDREQKQLHVALPEGLLDLYLDES